MSYTLRGRLESRLASGLLPVLVAAALAAGLREWWPVELAGLMVGVGLALDLVYHRALDYQPGWLAVPLGLLELAIVMTLALWLGVGAPLQRAIGFFVCSWLLAQALAHAGFPLLALSYAEDGGELGRAGPAGAAAVGAILVAAGGVAWSQVPPTVILSAGVHQGPLVLDHAQKLVGEPGAIVRGGLVVRASHVTVRDVTVVGGDNGIVVDDARHVLLERVHVRGATLDGIHARLSQLTIRDCTVESAGGYTQGIDISFAMHAGMSLVEGCTVTGGQEGIVTHSAEVLVKDNRVRRTRLRGITMTEMSMGMIERNDVADALGIGIFCGDYSMCEIVRNRVAGTRPDRASNDLTRQGVAIEAHRGAQAELRDNVVHANPRGVESYIDSTVERAGSGSVSRHSAMARTAAWSAHWPR
jgi:nitrous oxidase accessory protein NosD